MRFVGIDIGSERHVVAIVAEHGEIVQKPVSVEEDAVGYGQLRALLGTPQDCTIAMEATGTTGKICSHGSLQKAFRSR
jgi:transposase